MAVKSYDAYWKPVSMAMKSHDACSAGIKPVSMAMKSHDACSAGSLYQWQ